MHGIKTVTNCHACRHTFRVCRLPNIAELRRPAFRNGKARGACVVCVTWTVRDNSGQLLPRFVGGSRFEVGRKLLGNRYDAFRLQVSSSYREIFDRELRNVLAREDWQIVPLVRQKRTRGACRVYLSLQ